MSTFTLRDKRQVEIDSPIPGGRYNVNVCGGGGDWDSRAPRMLERDVKHSLLSLDVDEGVTPMLVRCPDDGDTAQSCGYPKGEPPAHLFPVRMIWRKPTNGELKRERREGGEHYKLGGLSREWVA